MNYVLLNMGTPESKCAAVYLDSIAGIDDEIHSLFLDFGMANREMTLLAAQNIAERYCTTHGVVPMEMKVDGTALTPFYYDMATNQYIPKALVTDGDEDKITSPRLFHYPLYRQKTIFEAMCYARIAVNASTVVAVHGEVTKEQLDKINECFNMLRPPIDPTEPIECVMPFMGMELADILAALGMKVKDIEDTAFCETGTECGRCYGCLKVEELRYGE